MAMRLGFVMSFLVLGLMFGLERSEGVVYTVGDATGWRVPTDSDFYDNWEDNKIFRVGDQLVFNWNGTQNVANVTEQQHDDCIKVTANVITTSPAIFNLTTVGNHYFITTLGNQCNLGQELEIEVQPAIPAPPTAATPPPSSPTTGPPPPSSPTAGGVVYTVGDATGWRVPTDSDFYDNWEDNKIFRVGDQLVFNWNGTQNVAKVTEQQHDDCTKVTANVISTSPAIFNLTTVGNHYFITTLGNQCNLGQELEIEVQPAIPAPPTAATPPPSSPTTGAPPPSSPTAGAPPPSSPTTTTPSVEGPSSPGSSTPPPPSSKASGSFGPMVVLSATFSIVVVSLMSV